MLRSDGYLFAIQEELYGWAQNSPCAEAFGNDLDKYLDSVRSREMPGAGKSFWQCCEYMPDGYCADLSNIWKVACIARRTGRFFLSTKLKNAKQVLCEAEGTPPWFYVELYDQSTKEYEARYRERVRRTEEERRQREEWAKANRRTVEFNVRDLLGGNGKSAVDHYATLRVEKSATAREIKMAYWKLARECHPDLNPGDPEAEARFKAIASSYEVLCKF